MATPTLVQHVSHSSAHNSNGGTTVSTYLIRFMQQSLANNCIIVCVNSAAGGVTPTVTDDQSNTYTQAGSNSDGNQRVTMFVCTNATAGVQAITVHFSTATDFVSGCATEFYNVSTAALASAKDTVSAGANPTSNSGSGTSITAASFTTQTAGDLIYQYAIQDTTSSPITSFTQGSSPWKLLHTDILDSTVAQFQVQAAAGALNPTLTMSPTNSWNSIAIALKSAAAGTAPTGMYCQRCQHNSIPPGSGSPVALQFPCSGNLLVVSTIMEPNLTISAIADGNSNTYSNTGAAFSNLDSGNVRHYYAVNPTTSTTMTGPTITYTGSPVSGSTVQLFDFVGASTTAPYDSTAGRHTASGSQGSAGSLTGAAITPSRSGGYVLSTLGVASNTINAVTGGGSIFLASADVPETSPWPNDQNNGWAGIPNAAASSATFTWTSNGGGAGNWATIADVFLPPTPPVVNPNLVPGPGPSTFQPNMVGY